MSYQLENVYKVYNELPSIQTAYKKFSGNKDATIASLIPLISKYNNKYGVALVHKHVVLEPGEVILSNANDVAEPVIAPAVHHPERWLASGEAYEFSSKNVGDAPPPEFFSEFRKIVGDDTPLGVFVVDKGASGEKTEIIDGRKSILKPGPPASNPEKYVPAAWVPGTDIVYSNCYFICSGNCN